MPTDAKRFLIFWPAIASVTIIGMSVLIERKVSWQSIVADFTADAGVNLNEHSESVSWEPPVVVELAPEQSKRQRIHLHCDPLRHDPLRYDPLHDTVASPQQDVVIQERRDHGSRAMQVPQRVANALQMNQAGTVTAPQFNELQELAGFVLQPQIASSEKVGDLSSDLLSGDILAADRIATDQSLHADRALGLNTLQRVPANRPDTTGDTTAYDSSPKLELPTEISEMFSAAKRNSAMPSGPAEIAQPIANPFAHRRPAVKSSVMPKSISNLAKITPRSQPQRDPSTSNAPAASAPIAIPVPTSQGASTPGIAKTNLQPPAHDGLPNRTMRGNPAAWPQTPRLNSQLENIASQSSTIDTSKLVSSKSVQTTPPTVEANALATQWAAEVATKLAQLRSLPRLGDAQAGELIQELNVLAETGFQHGELAANREQQIEWLVAAHSIRRRVAIWTPIWQTVNSQSDEWTTDTAATLTAAQIKTQISQVRQELPETGDAAGWDRYLMLPEISAAASADVKTRTVVAQRLLSRLEWHGLDEAHQQWLDRPSVNQLIDSIQPWARSAVDYASLLNQIERQESDAIDMAAVDIASAVQTLRFAENPKASEVAQAIETYYRNANVRVAMSEDLMRRMLPTIDPTTTPIRTTMFGSRIRGVSEIRSDLELDLQPSPDRWSFTLRTLGDINTQSVGQSGTTSVSTRGNTNFTAETPVEVSADGIHLGDSSIGVRGSTRLRGVRTTYDGWPLLGDLVRSIAEMRFQDRSPMTSRIANRRVRNKVGKEIDERLGQRADERSQQFNEMVLGPLSRMQLDPKVVDMRTTESRLVARYRLAGDWQIGAFTPRPRAPSDSLLSLQVNQSALNNMLEQVVPQDAPTTIEAAVNNLMVQFGNEQTDMPEDIPSDVTIQFTKTRPITVEIEDGLAWITFRIVELSRGENFKLRRFIVRAAYRPEINGLNVAMVREGHLRISGPGMLMRQRLPVRAIFNKVLSPNRALAITQPGLVNHVAMKNASVAQMELRDGWMALAISDRSGYANALEDRVAENPALKPTKTDNR